MLKKYSIILWLLIQLLIEVGCQTTSFKPTQRSSHTATLIDDKLYILGGTNKVDIKIGIEFFYLDVSVPFNTQNILWNDLTSTNTVPAHAAAGVFMHLIFKKIHGIIIRKDNLKGIVDYNGKMYLFGGQSKKIIVNDMLILDTMNLNWELESSINTPSPRVYIYDTINDSWSIKIPSGTIPSDRDAISAVLGLDRQHVIIFGGIVESQDSLYVLDLINYEWYIPKILGKIPSSRHWHEANVIGKYMVISFGYDPKIDNDILLLDISNNKEYIWTNIFDPIVKSNVSTNDSATKITLSKSAIIGIAIGSLVGGILLLFGGTYVYQWNKYRMETQAAIPTPGTEGNNGNEAVAISVQSVNNNGREMITYGHRQQIPD
ncbi:1660_t:CDS:2, partial [Funneliformis caledonium]